MTKTISASMTIGILALFLTPQVHASAEADHSPETTKQANHHAHDSGHHEDEHMTKVIEHLESALIHAKAGHANATARHTKKAMDQLQQSGD